MMTCVMCGEVFKEGIEFEEKFRSHILDKHLDEVLDGCVDLYTV